MGCSSQDSEFYHLYQLPRLASASSRDSRAQSARLDLEPVGCRCTGISGFRKSDVYHLYHLPRWTPSPPLPAASRDPAARLGPVGCRWVALHKIQSFITFISCLGWLRLLLVILVLSLLAWIWSLSAVGVLVFQDSGSQTFITFITCLAGLLLRRFLLLLVIRLLGWVLSAVGGLLFQDSGFRHLYQLPRSASGVPHDSRARAPLEPVGCWWIAF